MRKLYALPLVAFTILLFCWEAVFLFGGKAFAETTPVSDTQPPDPPMLILPLNGATVSDPSPTLTWAAPQDLGGSGIKNYRCQVDVENSFPAPLKNYYTPKTTYAPTLEEGHFFWRVYAQDNVGNNSVWSEIWEFNIALDLPAPPDTTPEEAMICPSNIQITEILPDPEGKDEEGEYIEIFNNNTTTEMTNIRLKDQNSYDNNQSGFVAEAGTTMPAFSYLVFYTGKKIALNNQEGDTVYLICQDQILDKITYPGVAPPTQSYNRQLDNSWAWSTTTTPGMANIITQVQAGDEGKVPAVYPRHIWINEFLPDPSGKDEEGEFIELYNAGPAEINLQDWQLDDKADGGSRPFTFKENFIISAQEYLALEYADTKIALNNSGDWVRLLWPTGQAIDENEYPDAPEGESYNKTPAGWRWSTKSTPGEENIITAPESSQEEGQESEEYPRTIWINEFLPDPEGKDEDGEFVELQNRGPEEIDLADWQLDDLEDAGSRPYNLPEESKILPDAYLVIYYQDSKIALNNDGDWVRLINPAGQTIDEIQYEKAPQGQSYSRQNILTWNWTREISRGQDNPAIQVLSTTSQAPSATQSSLPQTGPSNILLFTLCLNSLLWLFPGFKLASHALDDQKIKRVLCNHKVNNNFVQ